MFKNLTMDPPVRAPPLHKNVSRWPQETKRGKRGNVQKLNYGFRDKASLASHAHLSWSQETEKGGRRNVPKLNYGSPGQSPCASLEHLPIVPGDKKMRARKCSKT